MAQGVPINQELERMRSYLSSLSLTVTLDWLTGCIEYFRDQNSHYSVADLQDFVRKQWELSDLRDSSGGSLPPNLQSQIKITLRGKYAVQIESVVNISEPAYVQMQKVRKVDVGNVEVTEKKPETWEPRAGRMLKLKLCDGPHQAEAIEYRPLCMISEQILPGTKMLIIGPVDCRRGIFFLKPENVKVIGGEVDSLLITNHFENVLARTLGLPENPDPFSTVSDASEIQPPTSVADSQRSTYTPSTAPTSSAVSETHRRQPDSHVSVRNSQPQRQQLIHEAFRSSKPPVSFAAEEHNQSVDGTGWTVDELLAEGDEAFLELPEDNPPKPPNLRSKSYVAEAIDEGSFVNDRLQNRCNVASTSVEKSVFKVPQIPVSSFSRQTFDQPSANKSINSFFAPDDYIDALEMDDWNDEEMKDFIDVPVGPATDREVSKRKPANVGVSKSTPSMVKSNKEAFDDDVETVIIPSEPTTGGTVSDRKQVSFSASKVIHSVAKSNEDLFDDEIDFIDIPSKPSSTTKNSYRKQVSFGSSKDLPSVAKSNQDKLQNSRNSNVTSSFKWPQRPQSSVQSKQFNAGHSVLEQLQGNRSNTNAGAEMQVNSDKQLHNKRGSFLHSQQPKVAPLTSSAIDEFTNEEDWADAYLSSQNLNLSFKSNFEDFNKASTSKSPVHLLKHSPCSQAGPSRKPPSLLIDAKSPKVSVTETPKEVKAVHHDIVISAGDRASLLQSRTHIRPAISSPSHIIEESEKISKSEGILVKPEISSVPNPVSVLKTIVPFEYLLHLLKSSTRTVGTHKIKATIMSLLSQLKVENLSWSLSAKICDGTGTLEVQFSAEVLDELIGMSAVEFKQMKKEFSKNPLLKEKLKKILENTKQLLINLNCIFEIKFETDKMAQVVKLYELSPEAVNQLKLRLNDY